MNFGYVKDTAGISKPINLDDILMVDVTSDSIIVRYDLKYNYTKIFDKAAFYIGFNNTSNISSDQIRSQFYSWFINTCNSAKTNRTLLNTAIPQLEVSTAGLINASDTRYGEFAPATDQTEACTQARTTVCVLESKLGTPLVGTLILAFNPSNDLVSISDGSYSLSIGNDVYFITVDGSRIASIAVCPFTLDFVFDPNQQADGTVDDANYFTLAYDNYAPFAGEGLGDYYGAPRGGVNRNDFGVDQVFTGTYSQINFDETGCAGKLKSSNDVTWPSGLIVNGYLGASEGLGQLPVFGVKLANPSNASWNGAELWVSDDYYITGDIGQATWQKFNIDYWSSGFSHFGNGTFFPTDMDTTANILFSYDISITGNGDGGGRVFLPAGTDLNGNVTFNQVEYADLNPDGTLYQPRICD